MTWRRSKIGLLSGATAKWIANEFKEEYKNNLEKPAEELDLSLKAKFEVHAARSKLYRARSIAMKVASRDHEKNYADIPSAICGLILDYEGILENLQGDEKSVIDESKWPENSHIPPLRPPIHKKKNLVFKQVGHNKVTCGKKGTQSRPDEGSNQSMGTRDSSSHVSSVDNSRGSQSTIS
ncbi:hypothetical protein BUALT_Bualt14G0059600 [Buddleja alternifolia]|uniref:Uncharacterized protein n=1 Tax=Buddleja alternifolia TaxID=168488 RepID=A0AAV6WFB7_9LAMI|nr:hypothetical protein BUALT_Bualt14G0059600 [Buddleja alternifolia]